MRLGTVNRERRGSDKELLGRNSGGWRGGGIILAGESGHLGKINSEEEGKDQGG